MPGRWKKEPSQQTLQLIAGSAEHTPETQHDAYSYMCPTCICTGRSSRRPERDVGERKIGYATEAEGIAVGLKGLRFKQSGLRRRLASVVCARI